MSGTLKQKERRKKFVQDKVEICEKKRKKKAVRSMYTGEKGGEGGRERVCVERE